MSRGSLGKACKLLEPLLKHIEINQLTWNMRDLLQHFEGKNKIRWHTLLPILQGGCAGM